MRVLSLRIPLVGSFVAVLVSSALVGQTPADTAATIAAAERGAQVWLALVDKGGPFEPFGARRRIMARYTTEPPNAPPGQYVLLQYSTTVSRGRQVVETVVPVLDGKRGWRVSGYWVRLEQ